MMGKKTKQEGEEKLTGYISPLMADGKGKNTIRKKEVGGSLVSI